MKLIKNGMAGTMESCDIQIMVENNSNEGIKIFLESIVKKQFGDEIIKVIEETVKEMNMDNITIRANDKGALDCTIKARVQSAILRGLEKENHMDWQVI
ncbi:citrate lyase acyl carrier protein [Anaeromicrobium sediminis]|uniref:Citrate lyase acyl carrier protein n=1 Tax=Anaeromicrobium sediminis TaxID=1478221 RepID=A0A267MES3_9FIRM|nr:citrate lyase acyl carrier protein [Anaeromicrobium sediminis]PAB57957.1 citrate lyase acyl carrier protein [Anaeromicrobium sediminis]